MVCLFDGDSDFFDMVAGVLQGDILVPYLFIMCLDCILQILIDLIKENDFKFKITRSKWYPAKTMTCKLHRWSSTSYKYTCPSRVICL